MPAIKKQNLSYYWQKLFIDYDIAGFPASVDLPLKMTDPKQKLAVLNNALDHWKLLHNGLVIIHNKTDYQALESAWRLFNNLGQEAMIDRKMRQLTFTSSSWLALSYMLARSADISPRFKQRVDQGLEPFYDHIVPAPVTDFEEFMRAMPVLGLLKKLYMDNPALYPKYLYYGQALDRSLISFSGHITSLSAQDLAKLFFFIDFLEIKNPQKARAVTDLIIREEFGSYMSVSSFGSLGRDPKIRKLMQLSTLLTQQLTVSAARYFLENHPVTTDNAGNFLKAAWSWEDQSKDLFYFKPLYRLVAYFMAEDVYDFLQTHPAHDQRPLLRELTVLDPEIPEKDQIHSIKTYFQKLAVNVAQGNWRYIFYKIKTRLMDEGNFTDPITLRDSHDLQLLWPRAYNVKDLRQKDRTVAHLFIMDPQKGARVVAIKFDMGLKHGGVSTAKFIKYHPATKLALTFTLDFTDTLGKTKDIAIDRGSVKNWYMSTHRALGLIVVYKNGAMKIFDKSHLRISDLYFHPQDSPYTDRALDLRKIDDYFLLLQIAQVQQLSVAANNLLIDNNTTFSMPSSKGSQRLLLEFSDGRDGLLNVESYVTTNAATRIARALTLKNSAKVVKAVYLDTGFYDYLTVHTTKGDVALGHSDNPVSSNRMFWGI